jgi:hypothetical protein
LGSTIQFNLRKNKPPGHPVGLSRAAKEVLGETLPEVKRFFSEKDAFSSARSQHIDFIAYSQRNKSNIFQPARLRPLLFALLTGGTKPDARQMPPPAPLDSPVFPEF